MFFSSLRVSEVALVMSDCLLFAKYASELKGARDDDHEAAGVVWLVEAGPIGKEPRLTSDQTSLSSVHPPHATDVSTATYTDFTGMSISGDA